MLVLAVQLPLPCAQQLKLRPGSHEPFNGVEHLLKVRMVGGHHSCTHQRSPMLVLHARFSGRNLETPLELSHEGPYQRPLLLEAMDIAQEDVELNPTDPHGSLSLQKTGARLRLRAASHLEPILSKIRIQVE